MALHLFLAACWLALGSALLLWPDLALGRRVSGYWGSGIAFLLCLYNLARWYGARSNAAAQLQQFAARRRAERTAEESPPVRNPEFDFSQPPPPAEQPRGEQPS